MPYINHPACQDGPVSVWRWAAYNLSTWLGYWSRRLEHWALRYDDEIPF